MFVIPYFRRDNLSEYIKLPIRPKPNIAISFT